MPRDRDLGRERNVGITQNNLIHARNILIAQGNTSGYSSNDHQHTKVKSDKVGTSVKAQTSSATWDSTWADTLTFGPRNYVDSLLNNRPNTLYTPDAEKIQLGYEDNRKLKADNFKIVSSLATAVVAAHLMLK